MRRGGTRPTMPKALDQGGFQTHAVVLQYAGALQLQVAHQFEVPQSMSRSGGAGAVMMQLGNPVVG